MTPEEIKRAWQDMPKAMRSEIVSLYNEHWITVNTKRRLERIFGTENLKFKQPSVQVEPKFKVGDMVRVLENAILVDNRGKIATIVKQGQCCKGYGWVLDISKSVFLESELEPYTEENKQ